MTIEALESWQCCEKSIWTDQFLPEGNWPKKWLLSSRILFQKQRRKWSCHDPHSEHLFSLLHCDIHDLGFSNKLFSIGCATWWSKNSAFWQPKKKGMATELATTGKTKTNKCLDMHLKCLLLLRAHFPYWTTINMGFLCTFKSHFSSLCSSPSKLGHFSPICRRHQRETWQTFW